MVLFTYDRNDGEDAGVDIAPPRQSMLQVFFHLVRFVAVLDSLVMIICQCIIFARDDGAWLEDILRIYVLFFCCLFISSELQLEDKIRCLPAVKSWVHRGFFYTFLAVIAYQESTTLQLSSNGEIPATTIVFALQHASWIMYGLGTLYSVMGFFCVRKLRDRLQRNYDQEVGDRERLRQHLQERDIV